MRPRLYICFGMPKSGSTLAFQLSVAAARRAGFDQSPLLEENVYRGRAPEDFQRMLTVARDSGRELVVIKTHAAPTPDMIAAIEAGEVHAQAICRDPRDIALSMMDAARRRDAWGKTGPDRWLTRPEDAIPRLHNLIGRYLDWAGIPGTLALDFENTAFAPAQAAGRIAAHLGVPTAPRRDVWAANRAFTQFNAGRSRRHRREMTAEQNARWLTEFGAFVTGHCPPPPAGAGLARFHTRLAKLLARRRG